MCLSAAFVMLLSLTAEVGGFIHHQIPVLKHSPQRSTIIMQSSLRDQFFQAVDLELNRRFNPDEISRILRFTESCKAQKVPSYAPSIAYFEPSEEYVEGLEAKPWHDTSSFPWVAKLESAASIIQSELEEQLRTDDFKQDSNVMTVMGEGWSSLRLQRFGIWQDDVCARFPRTLELLASLDIPFAVRGVCFARQAPQTGVQPHSDGRNFILTAHLGLKIPKGCWIEAGGERRLWEEKKLCVLDTTFIHSTGNESNEDRYVLIIDFWHPDLTEIERQALRVVYDLRNQFEGRIPMISSALSSSPLPSKQPSLVDSFKDMFTFGK